MITTDDIKKYAELKGRKIEENFACTYVATGIEFNDPNMGSEPCDYQIGIELSNHIWYWWHSFDYDGYDKELYFQQRYSQNSGQITKGWRTGMNAEWKIKEYLELKNGKS